VRFKAELIGVRTVGSQVGSFDIQAESAKGTLHSLLWYLFIEVKPASVKTKETMYQSG
jgi:hypothetical protein